MSFQIVEIIEKQPGKMQAVVKHGTHQILVMIAGQNAGDIIAGESFPADIGYDEILDWKVIDDFKDARSGIWQEQDGIHLLGRVHNILDYGDGKIIMDVYIQNGHEFFTLSSEAVADAAFESNAGLEITVGSLYIYPSEN